MVVLVVKEEKCTQALRGRKEKKGKKKRLNAEVVSSALTRFNVRQQRGLLTKRGDFNNLRMRTRG